MNFNRVVNFIIRNFPGGIVKKLRKIRIVKEYAYRLLYKLGINKHQYFHYYLKYDATSETKPNDLFNTNIAEHHWGRAFLYYRTTPSEFQVDIVWADGPCPGNFGDWLSPYVISKVSNIRINHLNEASRRRSSHIVALGSIIPLVNKNSVVLGAGIASMTEDIDVDAQFVSVRGPYTAARLKELNGEVITSFGDIGYLLSRVYTPKSRVIKSKFLIVRHINQANYKLELENDFREASIFQSHPSSIENFIDELHSAEVVVTSAMHCFIVCISYGIPAILFTIGGEAEKVAGDGVKYKDALSGVGLREVVPLVIRSDEYFCDFVRNQTPYSESIVPKYLDQMEASIERAISLTRYK